MLFWSAVRFISLRMLKNSLNDITLQKEIIFLTMLQQNIFGQSFILLGKGLFFYIDEICKITLKQKLPKPPLD